MLTTAKVAPEPADEKKARHGESHRFVMSYRADKDVALPLIRFRLGCSLAGMAFYIAIRECNKLLCEANIYNINPTV